jgi:hypothetical protein
MKDAVFWNMTTPSSSLETEVSEEHAVSIFRVIDSESLTLNVEAICSSKTSIIKITTRCRHIPEDSILRCYRRENIKSDMNSDSS